MALPVTLTCRQTDSKTANLEEMWINQSERDHEASGQTASHPATHPPTQSVGRPASLAVDWSVMSTAEGTIVDFGLPYKICHQAFQCNISKEGCLTKKRKKKKKQETPSGGSEAGFSEHLR